MPPSDKYSAWRVTQNRGCASPQADRLDALLGVDPVGIRDLILAEVLQGIDVDRMFEEVRDLLRTLDMVVLGSEEVAVEPPGTSGGCERAA